MDKYLISSVLYAVLVAIIAIGLNLREPAWWVQLLLGLPVIALVGTAVYRYIKYGVEE